MFPPQTKDIRPMSEELYETEKGAIFSGMTKRELMQFASRQYDMIRDRESELSAQLETIEAYERATGYTPEQIKHIDGCTECGIDPPQPPEYCNVYREIGK